MQDRTAPARPPSTAHYTDVPMAIPNAWEVADVRAAARRRLPRGLFEFVDRGACDDAAVRNNAQAFDRVRFRPRVGRNVSARDYTTTLFGKSHRMPMGIAPTGGAGLIWHLGEIALARAARKIGIPFTLSTFSIVKLETVAAEAGGTLWFQLYVSHDRNASYALIDRARASGYQALVVTLDTAVMPRRPYNVKNGFTVPFRISHRNFLDIATHPRWVSGVVLRYLMSGGIPQIPVVLGTDTLDWDEVRRLRQKWPEPLILKGIANPEDAVMAADAGADGIIISNHGGRNLDSSMATLDALPAIVDAVGNRLTVMIDSGFRRGEDVLKAISIGAKCALIGRPTLYGLAAAGEAGAEQVLRIFEEEIDLAMAFLGCTSLSDLSRSLLIR